MPSFQGRKYLLHGLNVLMMRMCAAHVPHTRVRDVLGAAGGGEEAFLIDGGLYFETALRNARV